jgi:predicted nucleic acid-binding protein
MRYIDANVLVRYIAADDEAMFRAADALFDRVNAGEERVALLEVTIGEVAYVLASRRLYARPRHEIVERLQAILSHSGIQMVNKRRCLNALKLYANYNSLNFADSIICAAVLEEADSEVYSYDRGFDRVPGIARLEPAPA